MAIATPEAMQEVRKLGKVLGPKGCVQPRWMRPFKCTWYFCEPLLKALDDGPQKKARQLYALLEELTYHYSELLER